MPTVDGHASPLLPSRPRRRGAVLVELAICLPVILVIVFGAIEACEVIYLQQTLEISSYEGARLGIRKGLPGPGGRYDRPVTNTDVTARSDGILQDRSVVGGEISISVADVGETQSGQPITVTVSAPTAGNAIGLLRFAGGRTLTASTTMRKDYRQLPLLTAPPAPTPAPAPGDDNDD